MVLVELDNNTLAVLVAGLYCTENQVDSMAIPQSVWLAIAEKLEYFIESGGWDFNKISFEDWVITSLWIYPKQLIDDELIESMKKTSLYWEVPNGNAVLSVSMDVGGINGTV